MPIVATDIQLLASERMTDASDGGGRMTSNAIVSGALSNIFPKVSRTDAVYGRVNLRKVYAAVRSATLDMYGGAHAIVADAPDDAKIGCVLFATGSAFDNRTAARDRIESYVVAGGLSRMRLYGSQVAGSKAIVVYQRPEEPLPEAGDVLCLSVESVGLPNTQQYVRVTDIEHEVRTFEDSVNAEFKRRVITLKLSATLSQTFAGAEPSRLAIDPSVTKVRSTSVADASRYYGIQPVIGVTAAAALDVQVAGVYAPIVPSTNRETPISLAEVPGAAVARATAPGNITLATPAAVAISPSANISMDLHRPVTPGSLTISTAGYTGTDDGDGNITGGLIGVIDYETGAMTGVHSAALHGDGVISATFLPMVAIGQTAHTRAVAISLATRGTVYVETLLPKPAAGAVAISYRALGKWYRLQDDGAGVLAGDSNGVGSGTVDYVTGGVVVTLGALPDIDSAVIFSWGSGVHSEIRAGAAAETGGYLYRTLQLDGADLPIDSAAVVDFTVTINGAPVAASAAAGAAVITSGAGISGTVDRQSGRIELRFAQKLPDLNTNIGVAWTVKQDAGNVGLFRDGSAVLAANAISLAPTNTIVGGSMRLFADIAFTGESGYPIQINDDGAGGLFIPAGTAYFAKATTTADTPAGSIDYGTGAVAFLSTIALPYTSWNLLTKAWTPGTVNVSLVPGQTIAANWNEAPVGTPTTAARTGDYPAAPVELRLNRDCGQRVVAGSVLLSICGRAYWDNNGAMASAALMSTTADTVAAGSIDYGSGTAALTTWLNNININLAVLGCLTLYGADYSVDQVVFRTAGSPLRLASFYVQATTPDGTIVSGTSDVDGVITGAGIAGTLDATGPSHVDHEMGIATLGFTSPVLANSIRYNAIVLTNLPLDPALLGLDPVRLPMDGRVPIYRPGDIVVLHHTDAINLPDPVTPGQSYSLGRADLATASLTDSAGEPVLAAEWSVDLESGVLTIEAGALLAGLVEPLVATHRIEQMGLATDVQINGQVSLSAPLTREFPAGSLLSSALAFGDLVARVANVFDQATWSGAWADSVIGAQATAQYNDVAYPIEVLNNGAITERWRVSFTGTTAFQVIGENTGQIATGSTAADISVTNSLTGQPYFVLRAAGWGSGWATGNQLRFNTVGANAPVWIARTILGGAGLTGDAMTVEVRGDTD